MILWKKNTQTSIITITKLWKVMLCAILKAKIYMMAIKIY